MRGEKAITYDGPSCPRHADRSSCPRYTYNKRCAIAARESVKAWQFTHKEQKRAQVRAWNKAHPEKAKKYRRTNYSRHQDRWSARNGVVADIKRGFRTPIDATEKKRWVDELMVAYSTFSDRERCRVPNCKVPATEWDEKIYGLGHVPGNIGRLCERHNQMKRDAVEADLVGLLDYMRKEN